MPKTEFLRIALITTALFSTLPTIPFAQETGVAAPEQPATGLGAEQNTGPIKILPRPEPVTVDATEGLAQPTSDASLMPAFGTAEETDASDFGQIDDIRACPYKQIRAAYDEAVTGKDTLDTLAVEREILILCEERNGLVAKLLEGEKELQALLAPQPPETLAGEASATPVDLAANTGTAAVPSEAGDDPLARLTSPPDTDPQDPSATASDGRPEAMATVEPQTAGISAGGQCSPTYVTRYVSTGAADTGVPAVAGLTETTSKTDLIVKVGDALAGGYEVTRITSEGVRLARSGEEMTLPRLSPTAEAEGFFVASGSSAGVFDTAPAVPGMLPPPTPEASQ